MAVTYQTEGVKMPDIKKRETTEWIKNRSCFLREKTR